MIDRLRRRVLHAAQLIPLAALALALGSSTSAVAQDPSKWAVVRVGEEVRVVESSGVQALRDSLDSEYKEAVRQHADARKRAAKAKEKFSDPKPAKPVFKVLKDGFKTEELANEAREEWDARLFKKGAKSAKGEDGDGESKGGSSGGSGKGSFVAVLVGENHRVVSADRLKELRQDVAARDKQALADYQAAKKAAKKAKQPFSDEKPKKTPVKVLKKFSSQEEAEAYLGTLGSEGGKKDG